MMIRINAVHLPITASLLFCSGAVLSGQVDADLLAQQWVIAALFLVTGLFAALVVLYALTIRPLQADLASEVRLRVEADKRRDTAERRAKMASLAYDIDRDELAKQAADLKWKTQVADEMADQAHSLQLQLYQQLRETAPKPKPKRGGGDGERGGPPKF